MMQVSLTYDEVHALVAILGHVGGNPQRRKHADTARVKFARELWDLDSNDEAEMALQRDPRLSPWRGEILPRRDD